MRLPVGEFYLPVKAVIRVIRLYCDYFQHLFNRDIFADIILHEVGYS